MALRPDYVTSDELKAHLRITDTADDAAVARAITAASRAIDKSTNRQFGLDVDPAPRYYSYAGVRIECLPAFEIDDLSTGGAFSLDVAQDGLTYVSLTAGTDYNLWPWNAPADGKPYTHLVFTALASQYPAGYSRELFAVAQWGWTTVPEIVKEACLIQAGRFFVRRDSQYGIAGSPETGTELRLLERLDPDVALMLSAVRRHWGAK